MLRIVLPAGIPAAPSNATTASRGLLRRTIAVSYATTSPAG